MVNAPVASFHPPPMMAHAAMRMPGGTTSFFWLRVAVIAIASCLSVVAACVGALAND
jgi:hypothetical protein